MGQYEGLEAFRLAKFRLNLQPKESLVLSAYPGFTFRGGFGYAFKRITCPFAPSACPPCRLPTHCLYHYVFHTAPPPTVEILTKVSDAPHPFILEPPLTGKRQYEPGEELAITLILIGRALDYLPYFVYTFDELGRMGLGKAKARFRLDGVESLDREGQARPLYDGRVLKAGYATITGQDVLQASEAFSGTDRLTLTFLTPARIKYEGRLGVALEFHVLLRSLLRRLWLLSACHCGTPIQWDAKAFIEQANAIRTEKSALQWQEWARYSTRQKTSMLLGGFQGSITFAGDLQPFLPMLLLGTHVHVGKGATFGLGQYKIGREA